MKRGQLVIIVSFFISIYSFSQTTPLKIISSQGGFDIADKITLEWTLGEPFVETIINNKTILTQGFQQSFALSPANGISSHSENSFNSEVSPNPVRYLLNIHANTTKYTTLLLILYEMNGRIIKKTVFDSSMSKTSMDVKDLSSGLYLLQIETIDGYPLKTHKIIKY